MSTFKNTVRIYENVSNARLVKHEIENDSIAKILRGATAAFRVLDRTDPMEADLLLRLWKFRASILFTLLPFDDSTLALKGQMSDLRRQSSGLPDVTSALELVESGLHGILFTGENPKREYFLEMMASDATQSEFPLGLFHALSAGRSPGWPAEALTGLSNFVPGIKFISTRRQLRAGTFRRIVLPCACMNSNVAFLGEVVYSGRAPCIDVLLYRDERFNLPKRLRLPEDNVFTKRITHSDLDQVVRVVEVKIVGESEDGWVDEAFWQDLHGGARNNVANSVAAHYVLFCDGTGAFIPSGRRVTVLQEDAILRDERDLRQTDIESVDEGELIVLRSGGSDILLNEASDLIAPETGNKNLLDEATSWKSALEALLVTRGYDDIAKAVSERGVRVTANNIQSWAGPDVLGPGNEQTFKALLGVLADTGKLPYVGNELTAFINSSWMKLQSFRGVRMRAGNAIRQELFQSLVTQYKNGTSHFEDRTSVRLSGDDGIELLILKVACVDQSPAFVPPSKLFQLDDHRGNKWLG